VVNLVGLAWREVGVRNGVEGSPGGNVHAHICTGGVLNNRQCGTDTLNDTTGKEITLKGLQSSHSMHRPSGMDGA
jgi:hypothetical protein